MDENHLKALLDDIAAEEIGDEMNIWPQIQAQLPELRKQKPTPARVMWSAARVAAVLLISVLAGAIVYGFYQANLMDPSIPEAQVTALQMEETQDGLTVSLDWVYADVHRITLGWSTERDASVRMGGEVPSLQTADEQAVPPEFGGGGGGGGGPDSLIRSASELNFDASVLDLSGVDSLDLVFTLDYSAESFMDSAGSGSGGGGGGGGTPSPDNAPTSVPQDAGPMVTPTFRFAFTVPIIPAEVLPVEAVTGSADGISMTLETLRVTPSMTKFRLCSSAFVPDDSAESTQPWTPVAVIRTDTDLQVLAHPIQSSPAANASGPSCYEMRALLDSTDAQQFNVDLPYLLRRGIAPVDLTPERVAAEEAFFAEQGIQVEFDRGSLSPYGFGVKQLTLDDEDGDEGLASMLVSTLAFAERMAVDWQFQASR